MSRFQSYINSAVNIKASYQGDRPFAQFIKQFFASNKKYGARDRRQISALCYNYFRIGFAAGKLGDEEKMLLATFLCDQEPSELMERLNPGWNNQVSLPLEEKILLVQDQFSSGEIFPFENELSIGVNCAKFARSFLTQPDLFIRLRPNTRTTALRKLEKSKLAYEMVGMDCVRLPNATNVKDFFIIDKEVVIQDLNSQQVLNCLKNENIQSALGYSDTRPIISAWDCCAASGGKSILLMDILHKKVELTISDIRASIISNLHVRFIKAGIKEYKYFISDVTESGFTPVSSNYDLVICDAPCTGSGTWSRTPEQLSYFKPEAITTYSNLQQQIVSNALPHLRKGGLFVYITCSVFKKENELVAQFIKEQLGFKLIEQQLFAGYECKADNMFVAFFEKL